METIVYRIETERLVVRCWEPKDALLLKTAIDKSLEHLKPWMPWTRFEPQTVQEKMELLRGFRAKFDLSENYIYGIFNRDETEVLGGTGLHPRLENTAREIGYWVHVDHINRGIASEAASVMVKVGFEYYNLHRIEIHCDVANHRSAAVPKKLGFIHEATMLQRMPEGHDKPHDIMIWSMFAKDYPTSPAAGLAMRMFDAGGNQVGS